MMMRGEGSRKTLLGLIIALSGFLVACDGNVPDSVSALLPTQTADTTPEVTLYPIAITVHPGQAQVILTAQGSDLVAMLEQPGPTASFDLPAGDYNYEVRASNFETFRGTFSLPQNRHLEVWLNRP
jgi:hypothetical protein